MIRLNLCDYSDVYIHINGAIAVPNTSAQGASPKNWYKKVIFKKCAPFINCIAGIDNTQINDVLDIDAVMPVNNLIE